MKTYYLIRPLYDSGQVRTVEVHWIANNRKKLALISHRLEDVLLIDDCIMSYFLSDVTVRMDWTNVNKEELY